MHRLRTCAARLRPLTASQAAQTVGQQQPITASSTGGKRTFQPIRCYSAPVASEPFLNGTSSNYVEEMYYAWLENPKSVHKVRSSGALGWSGGTADNRSLNIKHKLSVVKSNQVYWLVPCTSVQVLRLHLSISTLFIFSLHVSELWLLCRFLIQNLMN